MEEITNYRCTVSVTLDIIGGKWKSLILWQLSFKTLRFSQLQRRLSKVTQKMLTQQLRELERDGLIHRKVYAEVPPRVEYSLTPMGQSVVPILQLMCQWGKDYLIATEQSAAVECAPTLKRIEV
ncbi:transcriptional regulator, HxlR family [Desulfuromusa kysingii]|uniref:Transcriptional regulator, HxlR family n=1 Tax=Desulfuromusa kysingii TaxID=37625 RepID=A0A1H3VKM1_9BACT|nr:helix-turn-helix domain-containing protein [Desulfuromusa kysingii]SDZ74698.1 transcriptional regulator, HxlR family [Desulfuromusa kysingii]